MTWTSKDRMRAAFKHVEADRVPIGEIEINSKIASQVIGRTAFTGVGGEFYAKWRAEFLIDDRREEYIERYARDLLDTWCGLGLDYFRVWFGPSRLEPKPVRLAENRWRYEDIEMGIWQDIAYSPDNNMWAEVDSSIAQGGLPAFRRYVEAIEGSEFDGIGMAVRQNAVSRPIDDSEFDALRTVLADQRGQRMFVLGNVRNPYPSECSWLPVYLEAMVAEPDLVDRFSEQMARRWMRYLRAQLTLGVDAVVDGVDFAANNGPLISPRHYRRFIQPYLRMYAADCREYGVPFIKHEDGNIELIEKEFLLNSGLDGYHAIEPAAGMDIGRLKRAYGDRITLLGNIDCSKLLVHGSSSEIEESTREVIRIASPGGGFVLSSSNSIHDGVPLEKYQVMIETAYRHGHYPIEA